MIGRAVQAGVLVALVLLSNNALAQSGDSEIGGLHLFQDIWWERTIYVTSPLDSDGDGIVNEQDDFPFDVARPPKFVSSKGLGNCLDVQECGQFPISWYGTIDITSDVAWGDVNGDGHLDLAVANRFSEDQIFLNHDGNLQSFPTWTSGNWMDTTSVELVDYDLDGDLDLSFTYLESTPTIWENHQAGFNQIWSANGTTESWAQAWGHLGNDPYPDLVIGRDGSEHVFINSNGSMPLAPTYTINATPKLTEFLAIADVNEDGIDDIVVSEYFGNTSLFHYSTSFGNNSEPEWSIQIDDIRGLTLMNVSGGSLDLAVARTFFDNIQLFQNDQGVFSSEASFIYDLEEDGAQVRSITAGDVDDDGIEDLLVAVSAGRSFALLANGSGLGTREVRLTGEFSMVSDIALGDVDGDGDHDVALATPTRNQVTSKGSTAIGVEPSQLGIAGAADFDIQDLNSDGWPDLAIGRNGYSEVWSGGRTGFSPFWTSSVQTDTVSIRIADVNSDGHMDVIEGNDRENIHIYSGDGFNLDSVPIEVPQSDLRTSEIEIGDVTSDGYNDIVQVNFADQNYVYLGSNTTFTRSTIGSDLFSRAAAIGSIGANRTVIAVGNENEVNRAYWWNGVDFIEVWQSLEAGATRDVALGDLSGDGEDDLVVANYGGGEVGHIDTVHFSIGVTFSAAPSWTTAAALQSQVAAIIDANQDGQMDLILGHEWQPISFHLNKGPLEGLPRGVANLSTSIQAIKTGLVNADSFPDVLVLSRGDVLVFFGLPDSDGDYVPDISDTFPTDPSQIQDRDHDGYGDHITGRDFDHCPTIIGYSYRDLRGCTDSDFDGYSDLNDGCPFNQGSSSHDVLGCPDSDGDSLSDINDQYSGSVGETEFDYDGDGIPNGEDVFPFDRTQFRDTDGDGFGDNVSGSNADQFPFHPSLTTDADGDGFADQPGDANLSDDCPVTFGLSTIILRGCPDQDGDLVPDVYDGDDDEDGISDVYEILAGYNPLDGKDTPPDTDTDGIPDSQDPDIDNDGWSNQKEEEHGSNPYDSDDVPFSILGQAMSFNGIRSGLDFFGDVMIVTFFVVLLLAGVRSLLMRRIGEKDLWRDGIENPTWKVRLVHRWALTSFLNQIAKRLDNSNIRTTGAQNEEPAAVQQDDEGLDDPEQSPPADKEISQKGNIQTGGSLAQLETKRPPEPHGLEPVEDGTPPEPPHSQTHNIHGATFPGGTVQLSSDWQAGLTWLKGTPDLANLLGNLVWPNSSSERKSRVAFLAKNIRGVGKTTWSKVFEVFASWGELLEHDTESLSTMLGGGGASRSRSETLLSVVRWSQHHSEEE